MNSGINEYVEACIWLDATLAQVPITGSSGAFEHPAPQDQAYPLVTWQYAGAKDVAEVAAQRIWAEVVMQVAAWGKGGSTVALAAIADEIDRRLQQASGSTTNALIYSCTREQVLSFPEVASGVAYRRLGGLYRLVIQKKGA